MLVVSARVDGDHVAVDELCSKVGGPRARVDMAGAVHEQFAVPAVCELSDARYMRGPWTETEFAERALEVRTPNETDFRIEVLADGKEFGAGAVAVGVVVVACLVALVVAALPSGRCARPVGRGRHVVEERECAVDPVRLVRSTIR